MKTNRIKITLAIVTAIILCGILYDQYLSFSQERDRDTCLNNLQLLDGAVEQMAIESSHCTGDIINPFDFVHYLREKELPVCPSGGRYALRQIGQDPMCSIHGGYNGQPPIVDEAYWQSNDCQILYAQMKPLHDECNRRFAASGTGAILIYGDNPKLRVYQITNMAVLSGLPIKSITLGEKSYSGAIGSYVSVDSSDLTPLATMPLRDLALNITNKIDLTPIAGMELTTILFNPSNVIKGLEALRNMQTLEIINDMPADQFWKKWNQSIENSF